MHSLAPAPLWGWGVLMENGWSLDSPVSCFSPDRKSGFGVWRGAGIVQLFPRGVERGWDQLFPPHQPPFSPSIPFPAAPPPTLGLPALLCLPVHQDEPRQGLLPAGTSLGLPLVLGSGSVGEPPGAGITRMGLPFPVLLWRWIRGGWDVSPGWDVGPGSPYCPAAALLPALTQSESRSCSAFWGVGGKPSRTEGVILNLT